MTEKRIGHLSDLHLDGSPDRRNRMVAALTKAERAGVDHLLLTGDLTKQGRLGEYHELEELLQIWPSGKVTIIPGNHDANWEDATAIGGPLERFWQGASIPTDHGDFRVFPINTRYARRALLFRALGRVDQAQLAVLDSMTIAVEKPVIIAMHHGPQSHPLQWFEGLSNRKSILGILGRDPRIHVCCGHDHRNMDAGGNQIHVAASAAHHADPLRVYRIVDGIFSPLYQSAEQGSWLTFGKLPDADR